MRGSDLLQKMREGRPIAMALSLTAAAFGPECLSAFATTNSEGNTRPPSQSSRARGDRNLELASRLKTGDGNNTAQQEVPERSTTLEAPKWLPTKAGYEVVDDAIEAALRKYQIPGTAMCIVKDGQVLYKQSYGYSDLNSKEPFKNTSLCRIASLTKQFTALTVLSLARGGSITLDTKVIPLLGIKPVITGGQQFDTRWQDITIRQLLQMTSGIEDRNITLPIPYTRKDFIANVLGSPLANNPGAQQKYSNISYVLLGQVIEQVTGKSYVEAVNDRVCRPLNIGSVYPIHTREEERYQGEVKYYEASSTMKPSIFPEDKGKLVQAPYGQHYYDSLLSDGGLVCNLDTITGMFCYLQRPSQSRNQILGPKEFRFLTEKPQLADGTTPRPYYGAGWWCYTNPDGVVEGVVHGGSLHGASSTISGNLTRTTIIALLNANDVSDGQHYAFKLAGEIRKVEK